MTPAVYVFHLILSVALIIGIYQAYFWCQRRTLVPSRRFDLALDDRIPFDPRWVWVYSGFYYPAILYLNAVVESSQAFAHVAASFVLLMVMQLGFFLILPVATPNHWRRMNLQSTLSERFLALVQRFDAPNNCFPSMHTSVAMLTALHFEPGLGPIAYVFPALIGASCVFTKQHYLVDVPAGALLGWAAYAIYGRCLGAW